MSTRRITISQSKFEQEVVMSDTFNELKDIVKDLLGADESKITPEARFREELEADSLDLVELIMAFEDKFGTEISDEDAQKITTVGEAVAYIDAHRGAK
jgi:acyl carrier protein